MASSAANVCLLLPRFTLTAQSLFQIKRQLDKLGELVIKVTYECDPIPLQKPHLEERVKYLLYHLIKRYELGPGLLFSHVLSSEQKTLNASQVTPQFKEAKAARRPQPPCWADGLLTGVFNTPLKTRAVCSQLVCGGDAAVHAHAPTETPHHQDRRSVHHQSSVCAQFMTSLPAQPLSNALLSVCFVVLGSWLNFQKLIIS